LYFKIFLAIYNMIKIKLKEFHTVGEPYNDLTQHSTITGARYEESKNKVLKIKIKSKLLVDEQESMCGCGCGPENESVLVRVDEKGDRCVRIAKRKYHKWPSAYASGAVVKCRQGKIWKDLKESIQTEDEYEEYELTEELAAELLEEYKPNFSLEKSQGLHGWFKRNKGKGWIDCKTGKPCGREKAGRGAKRKYPACRPTKAQCNKVGTRKKKTGRAISWKPKNEVKNA
jgi:hypothetical protein